MSFVPAPDGDPRSQGDERTTRRARAVLVDRHALDSLEQIVRVYDRAIDACDSLDALAASDALRLLRAGLELDSPAAHGFDALYAWCEESVGEGDFAGAAHCLRSLRAAWCRAVEPQSIFPDVALPVS